jgi:hypothetical protein
MLIALSITLARAGDKPPDLPVKRCEQTQS